MSSPPRRARRTDDNQKAIVKALQKVGVGVIVANTEGYDLIVAKSGNTAIVEVKDGKKIPSKRKLTDAEAKLQAWWPGAYRVVESVEDAIALAGELAKGRG